MTRNLRRATATRRPSPSSLAFVREIRRRNADIPIFLYGETRTTQHLPNEVLRELHGFIHMFEDTPEFVARYIVRESRAYLDTLAPPFFRALVHYAQDGSYSWHCPGHSGGVAFLKSPVGQMFHQFFGENMLRADVCNSVDELGQLLDHTGPVAASERNAARIFGADHLFFVTNGTSTSNKIVWHYVVAPGDVVIVDRNCHKSILHAITMTGAIPVFLTPTRNHYGIIGPIPLEEFQLGVDREEDRASSADQERKRSPTRRGRNGARQAARTDADAEHLRRHPLQRRDDQVAARRPHRHAALRRSLAAACRVPRRSIATCTQSVAQSERPRNRASMIFSTQSTHKMLAGLSQASQILIEDAQTEKLDRFMFNEAFLMHTSTSPQYAIIASCDVAAAMMEPPGGTALVEESISEALEFRRAMRKVDAEFGPDESGGWWFKVWGPDHLATEGIGTREDWMLKPGDAWHGFEQIAPGFNMLDPIKATVITPGLNLDGTFADPGIPAAIVTKYLAEHGIIVEKTGLYSFFIMFTIGITKGRWNTMVTELQQFKDDYDNNQPLWRVMPEFIRQFPQYEKMGLRELCTGGAHHLPRERYRAPDHRDVPVRDGAGDEAGRRLRADGAQRGRSGAHRRSRRPHHVGAADAVSARHPAADSGRARQPHDRALPAVRARAECSAIPGSAPTSTDWSSRTSTAAPSTSSIACGDERSHAGSCAPFHRTAHDGALMTGTLSGLAALAMTGFMIAFARPDAVHGADPADLVHCRLRDRLQARDRQQDRLDHPADGPVRPHELVLRRVRRGRRCAAAPDATGMGIRHRAVDRLLAMYWSHAEFRRGIEQEWNKRHQMVVLTEAAPIAHHVGFADGVRA